MKGKSFVEKEDSGQVNTRVIVGWDIGTTKIACFVGRKNEHNKIEGERIMVTEYKIDVDSMRVINFRCKSEF